MPKWSATETPRVPACSGAGEGLNPVTVMAPAIAAEATTPPMNSTTISEHAMTTARPTDEQLERLRAATAKRSAARRRPLTRVIATLGPASANPEALGRLIDAGVDIFRLNFSHGTLEDHARAVTMVREVSAERDVPVAILGDLQGPKIRVGKVEEGGIELSKGETVIFERGTALARPASGGEAQRFSATYSDLIDDVSLGERLLINDGAVRLLVIDARTDELECTVVHGGLVTSNKGINLPDTTLTVDSLTDRDREHATWALEQDIDLLALSFVRSARDIRQLRRVLDRIRQGERTPPIVAKIETPAAIGAIDEIVDEADAIMVARGDLGVEMDIAEVPVLQRRLVRTAREYGKPCVVATQMLESMISSPVPTRAEASDVANAIFEQTDATMLSGETAVGAYPVLAVEHMRRISGFAERSQRETNIASHATEPELESARDLRREHPMAALAHGVFTVAEGLSATCVVVWSQEGGGALRLSRHDFGAPIVAVTNDIRAARRMQIMRSVIPIVMETPPDLRTFTAEIDAILQARGLARPGDRCVMVAGEPLGTPKVTNRLAIHVVGDLNSGYRPRH